MFSIFNLQSREAHSKALRPETRPEAGRPETGTDQEICMNNESIDKLRVDSRLHRRRGWISDADLQRELDSLPDVSDKIFQETESEPSDSDQAVGDQAVASAAGLEPSEASAPAAESPVVTEGSSA